MNSTSSAAVISETEPVGWSPSQRLTAIARPINVLMIEDDPEAAQLAEFFLMEDPEDPFRVELCRRLVDAFHRLAKPGIDVILLDLGLPELSGYKSYRAIEAATAHSIPVVICTAEDRIAVRELTLDFGAADYLLKSTLTSEQLRHSLRSAVQRGWRKH